MGFRDPQQIFCFMKLIADSKICIVRNQVHWNQAVPVLHFLMACYTIYISAYLCWRENYETHDDGEYVKLHSVSAYKVEQIYLFQKCHKTWRKFSKSIVTIEIFINILLPSTQLSRCSKALLRNRTRRFLAGEEYFFSAATLRRVSAQIILTSSHQYSIPIGVITNMSLCKVPSDHARGDARAITSDRRYLYYSF